MFSPDHVLHWICIHSPGKIFFTGLFCQFYAHLCEFDGGVEGDFHHVGETILAFFRRKGDRLEEVVRDGEDGDGLFVVRACGPVEAGGFHFDAEVAEVAEFFVEAGLRVVEEVGGVDLADLEFAALASGLFHGLLEHVPVGAGGELSGDAVGVAVVGVAGGSLGDDDILRVDVHVKAAGGADADDGLDTELAVELLRIDADGGDAHAVAHDGDALALVGAGVAEHVAGVVEADDVGHEVVRHGFGAERISWHENDLGEFILDDDAGADTFSGFHRVISPFLEWDVYSPRTENTQITGCS